MAYVVYKLKPFCLTPVLPWEIPAEEEDAWRILPKDDCCGSSICGSPKPTIAICSRLSTRLHWGRLWPWPSFSRSVACTTFIMQVYQAYKWLNEPSPPVTLMYEIVWEAYWGLGSKGLLLQESKEQGTSSDSSNRSSISISIVSLYKHSLFI